MITASAGCACLLWTRLLVVDREQHRGKIRCVTPALRRRRMRFARWQVWHDHLPVQVPSRMAEHRDHHRQTDKERQRSDRQRGGDDQAPQRHRSRDRLPGWGGRTRTAESVRNKIHLNWRHNFRGNWPKLHSRDCSRLSCDVANMQLPQGFRQTLPARTLEQAARGRVSPGRLVGLELRNAERKKSGRADGILHSTSPLNRAIAWWKGSPVVLTILN